MPEHDVPEPAVSVVLPLYGNATAQAELVTRLQAVLADADAPFEVIGVDDVGPDDAPEVLARAARDRGVPCRIVRHPHNLGQHQAVLTGLRAAAGELAVVMDADLEDPPETVPALLRALRGSDAELVFGRRASTAGGAEQRRSSRLFKKLFFRALGADVSPRVGLFVALSKHARQRLLAAVQGDPDPYLVGWLATLGLPTVEVTYRRPADRGGPSAYTIRVRLRHLRRALTFLWRYRLGRLRAGRPEAG